MNLRMIRSPLRTSLALCALTFLAVMAFPGKVAAQTQNITGCQTISSGGSYAVMSKFSASTTPCIVVNADNVTITFGDPSTSAIDVSGLGDSGVAIDTGTSNGTVITGLGGNLSGSADIITGYTTSAAAAAIRSEGTSGITITGLTIFNTKGTCVPGAGGNTTQPNYNHGTAISIANATGATISTNAIECYQFGIYVSASNIPNRGTGEIGGNQIFAATFNNHPIYPSTVGTNLDSGGIVLQNSSGWTIDSNQIHYSGSLDENAACTAFNNDAANGCSAALQLTGTSTGNSVTANTVTANAGPGIYTAAGTSRNDILNNSTSNPIADLWDDVPPHSSNAWRKNTCLNSLGSVSPQKCP